jgi:TonB-linked SusC/RagA family outer membrane protein
MKLYITIFISALLLCSNLIAQEGVRVITGKILDATNNTPLPGANIVILPYQKGTITDANGNFSIILRNNLAGNPKIVVSFIGMEMVTITLSEKNYYEIKLKSEVNELQQVVVTSSYGTKKLKEEVVGSITSVTAKDIQVEQAFESFDKMLEGQLAGVNIEVSSTPLDPVTIDIRGQGSLSNLTSSTVGTSTQPLFIVDGVIMSEETAIDNNYFDGDGTYGEDFTNVLAQISPEDIESINVLKDAAAVSIYGADGANGVIIVTTKKGRKGKVKFNFSTQQGMTEAVNRIKYLNGQQFSNLRNEYLTNSGSDTTAYNGVDTDWYDLLNRNGQFQKYTFSASGGSDHFTYRAGFSYQKFKEAQEGNSSEQYRLSTNWGYTNKKFSASLSLNPTYIKKDAPNVSYSYCFAPNLSPYNEDGSYADLGVTGVGNPLAVIEQNMNITDAYSLITSLNLAYDITNDLKISSLFGLDLKDKDQDRYYNGDNESGQTSGSFELNGIEYPKYGYRVIKKRNTTKWNWQGQLSFNKDFNENHHFDAVAGMELAEEKTDFDHAAGRGYVNYSIINPVSAAIQDDDPDTDDDETYDNQTYSSDISYNSHVSAYSQLNYHFKKKYFALVNIRRDESSVFGDNTNVAYNGGAGVSWIINKESFLDEVKWLDFLRLRLSFGSTGNSRIGSYSSKGIYSIDDDGDGYNGLNYATPYSAPNDNLGWEKNIKYNAGIDFNFLDRFNLVVDLFYDDIKDMITSRDVPSETGYTSVQINGSDMYNKGIEIALGANLIDSYSFKWDAKFNIATLKNKVTSVKGFGDDYSSASRALALKEGHSTSNYWGMKWVGIDPATGRDMIEKDGKIYSGAEYNDYFSSEDWVVLGNSQPDFYGGFTNTFTYKNKLKLSIRGTFKYGADQLVDNELIDNYRITSYGNLSVNANDYWKEPGDIATQPAVTKDNPIFYNLSKYLYNSSHLKISNISLSYNVPVKNSKLLIKSLALNANVSNVAVFYKNKSPKGKNGIKEFKNTYPESRTYAIGVNASF